MKQAQKTNHIQIDTRLDDLIEIIQFVENVAAKIHSLREETDIFRVVGEEFSPSKRFVATILSLTDDGSSLKLAATSLSSHNVKAMEKAAGLLSDHYKIDLNKSSIFSQTIRQEKTIQADGPEILSELFPRPLVTVLMKVMGLGKQPSILTPLYRHENVVGLLSLSAPELADYFAPSVINLAQHISIALELADEYAERKRVEKWLRESEEKHRTLLSNTGIPITYVGLDGYILLANALSARNFGYTTDEIIGKSMYELLPDTADSVMKAIHRVTESGIGFEYEGWLELDSQNRWFVTNIQPVRDGDGQIFGIQVISHDITERRQSEKALRESEEKYRTLVEQSLQGQLIFQYGRIVFANDAFAYTSGYSVKELLVFPPEQVQQLMHPDDQAWVWQRIEDRMAGKTVPLHYKYRMIKKDSTAFWAETFSNRITYMGSHAMQVTLLDITERKLAEEETNRLNSELMETNAVLEEEIAERNLAENALHKNAENLVTIFENANDAIMYMDESGVIIDVNEKIEAIFGFSREEAVGHSFSEFGFLGPDDMQAVIHLFDEAVRTHPQDLAVLQAQRRDGSTVFIEASTKLVQRRNEAPEILVILRDITERQQAEEETNRLNKELMEANAVLEEEITERKRAEEALKQSEMRFRALFENASDGVAILNADGTVAYTAPSNDRMLGFKAGESGAATLFDQIHPEDRERLVEDFSTIMREPQQKVTSVYRALHKDGQWREIEATGCNLLDDPYIQGIVANFRDVTERIQADEALKDSEEKFRNIFESANDEIIYLDEAGTILDVNDRANDILGYSREELIGKNFTDFNFINPEGMEDLLDLFNKAVSGDNIPFTELVALRKDGSTISIELSIRTVQASSGKQGLLVIVRDILERKQAEEALRESEDKYRKVVELCSDGIVIIQDGIIKFANPRMGEIMDYDLGEGLNTPFSDHVDPGEISKLANYHQKRISGEEVPSMYETILKHKDGSRVFIEFNGSPIVYEEKAAVLGFVRDITGRKQAEEALKESEAHWRALVENAPNNIMSVDSEGTILSANRIVPGLTSEEVIGNTIYNFIVPEHHDLVREAFSYVLSSGEAGGYEIRGVGPDGRDSWWETQLGPVMHDGKVAAITLITTDITGRKEAEERILRHNRELAALNDIFQTVSQSIDLDGILSSALDKTLEILNVKHGAIAFVDKESESLNMRITRGASDNELESIPTIKLVDDVVGQVAKSGETIFVESVGDLVEQQNTRTQNLVYDHHLKSAMFVPLNARGRILGVMCVATQDERVFTPEERDLVITISHQISTAVENAQLIEEASRTEALEELDKLRTALLASVSHELRTPLTSIKGLASTLTQPDIEWDIDTQQEFLKIIDRESDILTHIVEDLMQMSQIEAGIMNLDKTQSSISSVVNQLSDQLGKLVKNHQFEIIVPRGLPMIDADEIRLGEVITNLVANAASYSEEGTKITLEAKTVDNHIMVSVSDEGIGISAEHVDKVFDRFYRLESGVARRRGGTGLGLAICKGIVEAHNGKIWVDTRNDQGSKFSFCLPISNDLEMESVESN